MPGERLPVPPQSEKAVARGDPILLSGDPPHAESPDGAKTLPGIPRAPSVHCGHKMRVTLPHFRHLRPPRFGDSIWAPLNLVGCSVREGGEDPFLVVCRR